jgi:hypothetical protein
MKLLPVLTLALALLLPVARAEDAAQAGRQIWKQHQEAVVTVRLVVSLSVSYGGREQQSETKTEAIGTVLDPSGLTLISLSSIDPSGMVRRNPNQEVKIDSQVKDVKILLADNTEIPAEVVLRDKDLDIAFLRPIDKPAKPLVNIDLSKAAKPQVLDETICLNRLGKVANRVVTVSIERIDALVERPRPFYVLSPGGSSGIGSPVFSLSGGALGIVLVRNGSGDSEANMTSMFSGAGGSGNLLPVIVPSADILEDAKQAMEAKKPAAADAK